MIVLLEKIFLLSFHFVLASVWIHAKLAHCSWCSRMDSLPWLNLKTKHAVDSYAASIMIIMPDVATHQPQCLLSFPLLFRFLPFCRLFLKILQENTRTYRIEQRGIGRAESGISAAHGWNVGCAINRWRPFKCPWPAAWPRHAIGAPLCNASCCVIARRGCHERPTHALPACLPDALRLCSLSLWIRPSRFN